MCTLSHGFVGHDLDDPNFHSCDFFRVFIMGERRNFKRGGHVDHSKSQPTDGKPSLKGARSRHVTKFKF